MHRLRIILLAAILRVGLAIGTIFKNVVVALGDPYLSDQEALDIAAIVNTQPRPKFVLDKHLPSAERLGEYNAEH